MSGIGLLNTCPACGAEESLDVMLGRMIDDDQVRHLIADVLTHGVVLGSQVVSYLRMHKPAKQRLRMAKLAAVLAEIVPDLKRGAITRKGRDWQAPPQVWRDAFAAVVEARDKGTLELPLEGNAYLYEIVMRQSDRAEAVAEKERESAMRSRSHTTGPSGLADVMADMDRAIGRASLAVEALAAPPAPPVIAPVVSTGPSLYARRLHAEMAARRAQQAPDAADGVQP